MASCMVVGCREKLSKEGHSLCLLHWKSQRDGALVECEKCKSVREAAARPCPTCNGPPREDRDGGDAWLSSTKLGENLGLSPQKMNLVLSELGWIEKYVKGWVPTSQGISRGAVRREARQTGVPYVVWSRSILENRVLTDAVAEIEGHAPAPTASTSPGGVAGPQVVGGQDELDDFRERFPATHRTTDGHQVRSRAEMLIDNWLYYAGHAHAYERRVVLGDKEVMYPDFYLPSHRVYIEYWGMESDPRYRDRMAKKRAIYAKSSSNLVELVDEDIGRLDDVLPQRLLKFGIASL